MEIMKRTHLKFNYSIRIDEHSFLNTNKQKIVIDENKRYDEIVSNNFVKAPEH